MVDPNSITITTGARKDDSGKPPLALLPFASLEAVAQVMAFGAEKYGTHNWRDGRGWLSFASAALRHLGAWIEGENDDKESGQSHLAHAACCLLFLLNYQEEGVGEDDRYNS